MKKIVDKLFIIMCLTLISCSVKEDKIITCDQVVEKYENLGYEVFHHENVYEDPTYKCYVKIEEKNNGDFIFFLFFIDSESAEEYEKENRFNLITYFLTVILGDATWIKTETYNNIEIEYENKELYKPFLELTK